MHQNLKSKTRKGVIKIMKYFVSRNNILLISQNDDGTLFVSADGTRPYAFAGHLIKSIGGCNAVLERCQESDLSFEEFVAKIMASRLAVQEERRKKSQEFQKQMKEQTDFAYNNLLEESGGVIPTTPDNIGIVLRYLNQYNWGLWKLPRMTIGYRCNQYNCDGQVGTTMILNQPIDARTDYEKSEGCKPKMTTKFAYAPCGYLAKYRRV